MIIVTLVCAPAPRTVFEEVLTLSAESTLEDAVLASGLSARFAELDWHALSAGIWGRAAGWDQRLSDGDRVELCRALLVDPKVARRERFKQQGRKGTGLFARQREGGKAGY